MAARKYSSLADVKTLAAAVTSAGQSTVTLNSITNLPSLTAGQTFTLVINPDTTTEEIITVTSYGSGNVLNVTRGSDSTTAQSSHAIGSVVKHMVTARDLQEAQDHIEKTTVVHGLTAPDGDIVATNKNQTLTLKTLTSPVLNSPTVSGGTLTSSTIATPTITNGTATGTTLSGGTLSGTGTMTSGSLQILNNSAVFKIADTVDISSTEIGYLNGVTSSIQTQLNSKPTVKIQSGTATVPSISSGTLTTHSVTFAEAFSSGTVPVVTVTANRLFASNTALYQFNISANNNNTGFTVQFINNTGSTTSLPFNWIAVGS